MEQSGTDHPGPAPTLPRGTRAWAARGEGQGTAASSGPVIAGVWGGLPSPPQTQNFSGLFPPFSPAELGAWASLIWEGTLYLKWTAAKAWRWGAGMSLARPGPLSNCSDGP